MSERQHIPLGLWLLLTDEQRKRASHCVIDVNDLSTTFDAQTAALVRETQQDYDEERTENDGVGIMRDIEGERM